MKTYTPCPVDTEDIMLPAEIRQIADQIAENVHEVWAAGRAAQGWSCGPQRDDAKKQHPCLVPYQRLSEEEKAYDWHTAESTLKYLYKQGFEIIKTDRYEK